MNIKVLPLSPDHFIGPYIISPIVVKVDAYQEPFGIERVEFKLDNELVATVTEPPYLWFWKQPSFGKWEHRVAFFAYDTSGNWSDLHYEMKKFL